jgi:hypothetical protein
MTEVPFEDHDDVLVRTTFFMWAKHVQWAKENKIKLSSLVRTLLHREIQHRMKGADR